MKVFIAYANSWSKTATAPLAVGVLTSAARAIARLEDEQGASTVEEWQVQEAELDHLLGED